jgi:hypothetical protein
MTITATYGTLSASEHSTQLRRRLSRQRLVVPVVNQIRTYWWCNPPKIGRDAQAILRRLAQ